MGSPLESEPSTSSPEPAGGAAPAGLGPGERNVVAKRYKLLEHIAEGGMGSVYKAEHVLSRKKLAVKVVHPYLCRGHQGVERFRREVSAAAQIDHPGIVQVYDAGVDDDGGFFMAMELLEGESLGDLLRHDWPGMATSVSLVEEMLEPLAKAHARGFIHRDLKPDNIFLAIDEDGRRKVKILDFGLAREVEKGGPTRTGITFGTPEYMSPEQAISARKVRSPGDVWSVGVMLYELLSGVHPFDGETPNAIMANAIKEPLPPLRDKAPHVPAPLAAFIERTLEKEPGDRPQTAGEMLDELRAVLAKVQLDETVPDVELEWGEDDGEGEDRGSEASPVPARERAIPTEHVRRAESPAPRPKGPRTALWIGAAVAVAAVLIGGSLMLRGAPGEPAEPREPDVAEQAPAETSPEEQEPEATAEPAPEPTAEREPAEASPEEQEPEAQGSEAEPPRPQRRARRRRAPAAEPEGPSPLERARECMARGDQRGALAALEGHARSAPALSLLIQLYRSSGRIPQSLDAMERFVRRFPRAPQTPGYREDLRRYGR